MAINRILDFFKKKRVYFVSYIGIRYNDPKPTYGFNSVLTTGKIKSFDDVKLISDAIEKKYGLDAVCILNWKRFE